ncbi:hypothetical protein ANN_18437 [Periplaneta americana]|uniref:Reverse transcriptase domain-containing protein n=1 Tax=Periplaneta americana TaxID=6978 RepID=A0ABQ8SP85_PERAM|nr:hypothetical protein ANN_18437 [Periplaneta americana]
MDSGVVTTRALTNAAETWDWQGCNTRRSEKQDSGGLGLSCIESSELLTGHLIVIHKYGASRGRQYSSEMGGRVAQLVEQLATDWKVRGSIPGGDRIFSRCQTFRTAPRFTQPPIKLSTGSFPGVKGGQSVVPTAPPHSSAEVILRRFINSLGYLASECDEGDNAGEMSPGSNTGSYPAFAHIGLRENPEKKPQPDNSSRSGIEPVFAARRANRYFTDVNCMYLGWNSVELGWGMVHEEAQGILDDGRGEVGLLACEMVEPCSPPWSLTWGSEVGGRRIKCVRFADDMALLAEEEMILKDTLLELNNSCEQYGMNINANKTKTMVIGRKVKKKKGIFCEPLEKEVRKRLVECFVWSVALYGAETWTLRRSEEKRIEVFEMWIWRRMECVKWTDRIRKGSCVGMSG